MPSRDFQLHFCQSLAGLSNEGSVDQGDSSHSHQLVPIQNWTGSLVCSGLHPFRAICIKTHCIKKNNGSKHPSLRLWSACPYLSLMNCWSLKNWRSPRNSSWRSRSRTKTKSRTSRPFHAPLAAAASSALSCP